MEMNFPVIISEHFLHIPAFPLFAASSQRGQKGSPATKNIMNFSKALPQLEQAILLASSSPFFSILAQYFVFSPAIDFKEKERVVEGS